MWRRPFVLSGLVVLTLCACNKEKPPEKGPVLRPVRTMRVASAGGQSTRKFSGVTQAGMESKLSFKVSGTLRTLKVKVGQTVKKGQPLAELDDADLRLQVQQAQATYAQAKAQETNARNSYDRTRKLYETNNASRSDLDAARAAFRSTRANVASAGKAVQLARSQVGYAKLAAPSDGAVSAVAAEVNENVKPGQTILVLSSGGRPEVKVAVPEAYIAKIKQNDEATVTLDAIKGVTFKATITEVGVATEKAGATYSVIARIERPTAQIRPGMAAEVTFRLGGQGDGAKRFFVPPFAVSKDRKGGRFLFVAEAEGKGLAVVRKRPVEVGQLGSRGLEIAKGLKEGERVITAGVSKIRDGLKVKLMDVKPTDSGR